MQATLASRLDSGFSQTGNSSTSLVPFPFPVALNGHPYVVDLEFKPWKRQAYRHTSVAMIRAQSDTSNEPGQQSLSPDGLWRRTQDSWHLGAGQTHLDRKNSSEFRYSSSKGIDPWTPWQLSLLHDTDQVLASTNTDLGAVVAGSNLYVTDGQALKFTSLLAGISTTWTTVTGTPAVTPSSLCSDGHNVWVAYGASGLYTTTSGASGATQYVTSPLSATSVVGFVMGRLMVAVGPSVYNVIASGVLPTALFTSNYSAFSWVGFSDGLSVIYAAGNSGDRATIYRIGITTDGTSLSAPVVAGSLPYGETVQAIYGYVGGLLAIGSSDGWRLAEQASTAGDLNIGPLTTEPAPVNSFSGFDRFIWGTYTDYDASSTGLFRMDPTNFTDASVQFGVLVSTPLVPAWATDLMVSGQGSVLSVVHFNGQPVIAVSGLGIYTQAVDYVASGSLDTGMITYGISDNKVPVYLDLSTNALGGKVTAYTSYDGAPFVLAGTDNVPNSTYAELPLSQVLSGTIGIREILSSSSDHSVTPVLTRHTLRCVPAAVTPTDIYLVVVLRTELEVAGAIYRFVPSVELDYLEHLRTTHEVCLFQEGVRSFAVTVESIDWIPEQVGNGGELNGVAVCQLRTVV